MEGRTEIIEFDENREKRFRETLAKYPTAQAALLPALWIAIEQFGALSDEVLEYVAGRLDLSPVHVFAVAEFYTMFNRERRGRYHIQLCRNLSCTLLGAEDVLSLLEEKLGIGPGGKTPDGLFSLELVECLGSCGTAPVMRINDTYYENLDRDRVSEIIEACRNGGPPEGGE
jgi:NADH-quinone oxidoreductase subunit E